MAVTPGARLYAVRLACGDGHRKAEPLEAFVARVKQATGTAYLPTTVSMLERDKQGWSLSDAIAFAAVDPLKRGAAWLAFGEGTSAPIEGADFDPRTDRKLTSQEEARVLRAAEIETREQAARARGVSGAKRPHRRPRPKK